MLRCFVGQNKASSGDQGKRKKRRGLRKRQQLPSRDCQCSQCVSTIKIKNTVKIRNEAEAAHLEEEEEEREQDKWKCLIIA
jgi:hypothetical protein